MLSDEDVQRLVTNSSIVETLAASSPQHAVNDSSSTSASLPALTASTSSTQLLASSFGTTWLAQQLQTAYRPTTPSGSDLLRASSSLLLNPGAVLPASSLPLPYIPPNTWPRASFAYVPPPMALIPGVSTSGSSQVIGMPLSYSSLRVPAFQQDFVVGPSYNSIPHKTVVGITSGQYIDLATLLTPQQPSPVPIISVDGRVVLTAPPRPSRRLTDISDWLQAFTMYTMVVVSYAPHHAVDLLAYQLLTLRTSKQFQGLAWRDYDEAFRRDAAARAVPDWSRMHVELYLQLRLRQNCSAPGWNVLKVLGLSWALRSVLGHYESARALMGTTASSQTKLLGPRVERTESARALMGTTICHS